MSIRRDRFQWHKQVTEEFNLPNFCASPWNSLHEGPQGLVSTCCKTREPIGWSGKQSFEDMYNSEHAKSVRAEFLRGGRPAQCASCWVQETNGEPSLNRVHGSDMSSMPILKELVENTNEDGTLNVHKPEWLDLLWTSKCNFACLGCSPELSSTINNKYKKEFAILNGEDPKNYHSNMTNWDNGTQHKLDYVLRHSDTIRSIHLNGGEPWMAEETYELLEELLKRGLHKTIQIWSHTNGSITRSYKGKDIISDYLVHWGDNCKVTMSNDGFGSVGEYVRYGYKDKKWLETYHKVREAGINLGIQTCWNMFNALNLDELGEWIMDNCPGNPRLPAPYNLADGSLTMWNNRTTQPCMLNYIPELQQRSIDALQKLEKSKVHPYSWREYIQRWIKWQQQDISKYKAGNYKNLLSWKRGIDAMDLARGTDLCTSVPLLTPLYEYATEIERQTDQTPIRTS
jgi:hypothetical protein